VDCRLLVALISHPKAPINKEMFGQMLRLRCGFGRKALIKKSNVQEKVPVGIAIQLALFLYLSVRKFRYGMSLLKGSKLGVCVNVSSPQPPKVFGLVANSNSGLEGSAR